MQILNFIREEFDDLYESSLRKKILLIGPSELYAILEFLKTAVETVRIQESSKEITKLVQDFKREWSSEMLETLETLRKQLDTAHSTLNSDILGTRKRKLESYIDKINNVSPSRDSEDTEE
jgi:DNA anti-recombination protein RmuC